MSVFSSLCYASVGDMFCSSFLKIFWLMYHWSTVLYKLWVFNIVTIFKGFIPFIVSIKYRVYSRCYTSCSLFILYLIVVAPFCLLLLCSFPSPTGSHYFVLYLWVCVLHFFLGGAPAAYGGSQARGWIGAAAAGLHHSYSHSHMGSEPHLRPTPQLTAPPAP